MFNLLLKLVLTAAALIFVAWVIPGISITGFVPALWAAFIMGLLNIFIRPILLLLTLPINLITLGLFTFVINALLFLLASTLVSGFIVANFLDAILGSILLSIISLFVNRLDL